jgi:prepilin-type N-terminal cleavage/methylation domain-containing protein
MEAQKTTPTLKAGISMSSNHTKPKTRAFTFIEVIIALAVLSISLLGLIRLQLININLTESAEITSQATLLAQQKIAEVSAAGFANKLSDRGTVKKNALSFNWQTQVTDIHLPKLNDTQITGLKKISVDINWQQGLGKKHLQMETYIADRKLQ